jgi:hypothetical protein
MAMKGYSSFFVFLANSLIKEKTRNQRPTRHFLTKTRHRVLNEPVGRRDTPSGQGPNPSKALARSPFRLNATVLIRSLATATLSLPVASSRRVGSQKCAWHIGVDHHDAGHLSIRAVQQS